MRTRRPATLLALVLSVLLLLVSAPVASAVTSGDGAGQDPPEGPAGGGDPAPAGEDLGDLATDALTLLLRVILL